MPHLKIWTIAGPLPKKTQNKAKVARNVFPKILLREKMALRYHFEQKRKTRNARFGQKAPKRHRTHRCAHKADAEDPRPSHQRAKKKDKQSSSRGGGWVDGGAGGRRQRGGPRLKKKKEKKKEVLKSTNLSKNHGSK